MINISDFEMDCIMLKLIFERFKAKFSDDESLKVIEIIERELQKLI